MKVIYNRREILKLSVLAGIGLSFRTVDTLMFDSKVLTRPIPSSGESLPAVGLGTWQTFDVGSSSEQRKILSQVLKELHRFGGAVIDSSPMYGSSEKVVGDLTSELNFKDQLFYATKVWTSGQRSGVAQMEASMKKMGRSTMDLIQIHNLVDWNTHVKTLKQWKEQGKIRYWGITHYVDSSHASLEAIIKSERPDFVQFNYSILSRHAEKSLFDTAKKYGVATIINQPYAGGSLFRKVRGKELPDWTKEWDINSWGQYFLKFILSNPAVTCAIPGTSKPHHMIDNMKAGLGKIPDEATRMKMVKHLKSL
ncbi:aldo/keto reductase [Flagellimonas nanhaiensis]|uniref:Aldo/keto reductase n=1 Tax=Flagellimonas nanhaiensis TaxID=2292706 RepID=A0A371JUE1_9FLAO|nr:aldo/keto reductase [Allomuricauda nanhaiensis]RDY61399.1 aldo/keto reductase [Allomuricauda nanhaiensis]